MLIFTYIAFSECYRAAFTSEPRDAKAEQLEAHGLNTTPMSCFPSLALVSWDAGAIDLCPIVSDEKWRFSDFLQIS